jgi:hypothetical protein
MNNCIFDDLEFRGVNAEGISATLNAVNCTFKDCQSRGIIITGAADYTGIGNHVATAPFQSEFTVPPSTGLGVSSLDFCTFDNPIAFRDIELVGGGNQIWFISNCVIGRAVDGSRRQNGVRVGTTANVNPGQVYIQACQIDCGTSTDSLGTGDPAGVLCLQSSGMVMGVDRSLIYSKYVLGNAQAGVNFRRATPVAMTASSATPLLRVLNSVLEGGSTAIWVQGAATATSLNGRFVSNTIVAADDTGTTWGVLCNNPTVGSGSNIRMRHNIILGYGTPTFTNGTGFELITNRTSAAPDPLFVYPNPFVLPTMIGGSDYRLSSAASPAYGAGAQYNGTAMNVYDLLGVNRVTVGRTDQGAYNFNPGPNAAKSWWTMF